MFNYQYVLLMHVDDTIQTKRAYRIKDNWYSNPYLINTRTKLSPRGFTKGQPYIYKWEPITEEINKYYYSKTADQLSMEKYHKIKEN